MQGVYAIIDVDFLGQRQVPLLPFAEQVLAGRPAAVQLRAKNLSAGRTLALLRELVPLSARAGVPLFANDRPDLAVLSGAPGVHVGQEDLPVEEVRRFAPSLRVGVSTHSFEELESALAARPDYVAFGPVFATSSKERPSPVVGLEALARASSLAKAAGIPLVAIGGIDLRNAQSVGRIVDVFAVISALLPSSADGAGLAGVSANVLALGACTARR